MIFSYSRKTGIIKDGRKLKRTGKDYNHFADQRIFHVRHTRFYAVHDTKHDSFSEQWAYRFQSVVDELCNNAIEFGSAPGKEITVTFINHPDESIEITVEDTGTGKSKVTAENLKKLVAERSQPSYSFKDIRGRGLAKIVAAWTDELEFIDRKEGGIKVRIKNI